jgi:hypothetical protein
MMQLPSVAMKESMVSEDDRQGETNACRGGERLDVAALAPPDGYATRVAYYALRKLDHLPNSQLDYNDARSGLEPVGAENSVPLQIGAFADGD